MWLLGALVAIAAIVILSLIVSGRAGGWTRRQRHFQCTGVVVGTHGDERELLLRMEAGSRTIDRARGTQLAIAVAPHTAIVPWTGDEKDAPLALADLAPGARVNVSGVVEGAIGRSPMFAAARVIVQNPGPGNASSQNRMRADGARESTKEGTV